MVVIKGADIITETQVLKGYVLGWKTGSPCLSPRNGSVENARADNIIDAEGLIAAPTYRCPYTWQRR